MSKLLLAYLLLPLVKGHQVSCPVTYPGNCKCFPKSKWVLCENMQATTVFPRGIFNNSDVQWLTVEKSGIRNLTKRDMVGLENLKKFGMNDGSLSYIEKGTFQHLGNLTEISLKGNRLVTFPNGVFANLSKLQVVYLSENPFEVLPDAMFVNSPLEKLILQESRLNSTGLNSVGNGQVSSSISVLYLSNSNFTRLVDSQFSGLRNLEDIDLMSCNIQYIGKDFLSGTKVTKLDLYRNPIMKIDRDAFRGAIIDWFDCRHCGLTSKKLFGSEKFLQRARALKRLDLGRNDISHIPNDAFSGLEKLDTLLLFYNNISTIDENPFTILKDTSSFAIQANPFKCDCHLAWFHKYAMDKINKQLVGQDILKEMICASPSNIAGKKFPDLKTDDFCCRATSNTSKICGEDGLETSVVGPTSGGLRKLSTLLYTSLSLYVGTFHFKI